MDAEERYRALARELDSRFPGEVVSVPRAVLTPRPRSWRRSVGVPYRGALLQWRDGVVHVHETRTHYHLHRDSIAAHEAPIEHLREDAPHLWRRMKAAGVVALAASVALLVDPR